jgi:hypothetical protein
MRVGFALDSEGDFLIGSYDSGHTSIAICGGAELIAQSIKVGIASSKNELWFNLSRGIDKQALFYNPTESDEMLVPMRSLAIREYLQSFEHVVGLEGEAIFERAGDGSRVLNVKTPCVILDCDASNNRVELGVVNVCN